jgi:carboxypeptidase family protein
MNIGASRSAKLGTTGGARAALLVTVTLAWAGASLPATAAAEVPASHLGDPAAPQALGRVFAAGPTSPALFLVSTGGYGYTESVLNAGDAHHRASGSLAVEGRPLSWFGLGLRLDGRYDRHQSTQQGSDDGWIGDPRVFVRADRALGSAFRAGGRLGLWLPGRAAPSIALAAATPELSAALTWAPHGSALWLTANGGYRLNRSARTATDASMLSASDRLGLELSAFDQTLLGLAAVYGDGPTQGFVELTAELMVGAGSPPLSSSPLRAGGGMRFAISRDIRLEAQAEAALGARPALSMSGPLVPVPPRAAFWLGVAYRFGGGAAPRATAAGLPPRRTAAPTPPPPVSLTREGRVVAADGAALIDPRVTVQADGAEKAAAVDVDADGRFTFSGKAGQIVTIEAQAAGYEPAKATVTIDEGAEEPTLTLRKRLPSGQIRGLIRSFRGVALSAEIQIAPGDRTLQAQDGRFEVDVAPGTYEVTITAPGYETQRRRVDVELNGVTLLNADLRSAR